MQIIFRKIQWPGANYAGMCGGPVHLWLAPPLTLQVLEGERHDAPRSSSSHQALDVGGGQREDKALLSAQVSAGVEGDEDGLVHARSPSGHHAAHCVGQLLGHQEGLQQTHV